MVVLSKHWVIVDMIARSLRLKLITASTMECEHYCSCGAAMCNTWLRDILMRLEVKLKCSLIIHQDNIAITTMINSDSVDF
jgi:hypothetical protein